MSGPLQPNPNFEVFNEDIEIKLKEISDMIGSALPEGWGFSLLIFKFGPDGDLFYTSNAQRDDMIATMKQFIIRDEAKHQPPAAGQ